MSAAPPPYRDVFCNRTLNLRSIRAIGYDMDYTLVHYHVRAWELRAYEHLRERLRERGWPVAELVFDPELAMRGLVIDAELGNLVKADRFGYVKKAMHGTRVLEHDEQRRNYARSLIDLGEKRFYFLNTLFSLSEACMYAQLVELLDERRLPGVLGYADLFDLIRRSLDAAHMEGALKAEIVADPERFVELDPDLGLALLDQRQAGKRLMLITNSDWAYTRSIMTYAVDRFLPRGMRWRELFELVVVSARKPVFYDDNGPMFAVDEDSGVLRPLLAGPTGPGVYFGGTAAHVERYLGLAGAEILYVGDHMYSDVKKSKAQLRWRTTLVLRELEGELEAVASFTALQAELTARMAEKEALERRLAQLRLALERRRGGYAPHPVEPHEVLAREATELNARISALDEVIAPLARAAGELHNRRWGLLMRAGNDKSHLARQVERSADLYTSRVSNFLWLTPFMYLRAPRGTLPHDASGVISGPEQDSSGD